MRSRDKYVEVLGSRIHLPLMTEIIDQMEAWIKVERARHQSIEIA